MTKKLPPAELVRNLEESIDTTKKLFADLTKYRIPKKITDHVCKIGAGIVDVLPLPFEAPKTSELEELQDELLKQAAFQCGPPFEGTARVRMQNLLSNWHDSVKTAPRKKREGQKKEYKTAIVYYAVVFLSEYYGDKLGPNSNSTHLFVERFYKRVTAGPERGFDDQIRKLAPIWSLIAKKSRSNS